MADTNFSLQINDLDTFIKFVEIIRDKDADKIRELISNLNKETSSLSTAVDSQKEK